MHLKGKCCQVLSLNEAEHFHLRKNMNVLPFPSCRETKTAGDLSKWKLIGQHHDGRSLAQNASNGLYALVCGFHMILFVA